MEFNQDVEIYKGEIIKNVEIEFDDYMWECINPNTTYLILLHARRESSHKLYEAR